MLHQLSIIPIVASTCKGISLRTGCVSKLYDHLNLHLLYCISCSRLKRNSLLLTFCQTFNVKWMKLSFSFSKPIRIAQIVVWDNCPAEKMKVLAIRCSPDGIESWIKIWWYCICNFIKFEKINITGWNEAPNWVTQSVHCFVQMAVDSHCWISTPDLLCTYSHVQITWIKLVGH